MFVAHLTAQGIVMKRAFLLLTLALVAQPQIADLTLSTIPSRRRTRWP